MIYAEVRYADLNDPLFGLNLHRLAALAAKYLIAEDQVDQLSIETQKNGCPMHWQPEHDDAQAFALLYDAGLSLERKTDSLQPLPWYRITDPEGRWTHVGPRALSPEETKAAIRQAILVAAAQREFCKSH